MPSKKEEKALELMSRVQGQIAFQQNNWNPYFASCDRYYHGFRHNLKWPNGAPRSNMKLNAAADIAETQYSKMLFTLFYSGGENFFDFSSASTKVARANTERLRYLLYTPYSISGKTSFFCAKRGLRYMHRYGVGAVEVNFNEELQRPVLSEISIRDILWDPMFSPFIDESEVVTKRGFISLEKLKSYRSLPGYNVPSDKEIKEALDLHADRDYDEADLDKAYSVLGAIGSDVSGVTTGDSTLPAKVRVYRVTTLDRIYWLSKIGPEPYILFEGPNRFGFQPYAFGFYRTLLESFGGRSLVDIVSGDHEAQQKAVNLMFDIADMTANAPRTIAQGSEKTHPWGPGALSKSSNPEKEQTHQFRFPSELLTMYEQSRQRMNRDAGTNDMAINGLPTPSNANRTLGGMQLQSASASERDFGLVTEIEELYVAPMLTKLLMADARLSPQSSRELGLTRDSDGKNVESVVDPEMLDPLTTITLRGATRMVGVQRLAGALQPVMQHMFDPQVQAMAAKHGWAPNFEEYNDFFHEATGTTRKFSFYTRMTPQDQQAFQSQALQGEQIKAQARQQSDQIKAQTQMALEQLRQDGLSEERIIEILKLLPQLIQGAGGGQQNSPSNVPDDAGAS